MGLWLKYSGKIESSERLDIKLGRPNAVHNDLRIVSLGILFLIDHECTH